MISLQSHNQVLYHLMQLTSAVGSRSTPSVAKPKSQNETVLKRTDELCESSSTEVTKSCQVFPIAKLNATDVFIPKVKKNNLWIMLDDLSVVISKRPPEKDSKWTISYISGSSFTDNKQGVPTLQIPDMFLFPAVHLPHYQQQRLLHSLHGRSFHNHVQMRGFKSRRVVKEEELQSSDSPIASLTRRLRESFSMNEKAKSSAPGASRKSAADKFHNLLNTDMPAEEQNRIKFAFVEGYEAGLERRMRRPLISKLLGNLFTLSILLVGLWYLGVYKRTVSSIFKISIGTATEVDAEEITVTFDDVKGVDQAKQELTEVVEFLKNPDKFVNLGGKLPKGILLVGEPGTGKTLLARAVAGEAGVPFFHAAGPEFDEVLVGQGARRVRDLFKAAKDKAPCVVFIDEIDSIGSKRTNSALHPYANQTINQLLSEMDGFHQNEGVIVLGATNRRGDLDKALLRPGRFDVEVHVDKPNYKGRIELWKLYLSKIMTRDMDPELLARCTTGFTGADIENMVNQAALRAAIESAEYVNMKHMEYARDKVMMGPEGAGRVPDEQINLITAYHEGGHALVAQYTKHALPIHKVTIIPRGHSLGHTAYLPEKDTYLTSKAQLLAKLDVFMGGRAAEELIFGSENVTTGARSDLEGATRIAEEMVKSYGMSEKVGLRIHVQEEPGEYSQTTNELIDVEVKRLLQESFDRAKTVLKTHSKELKTLAEALLKYETLDAADLTAIVEGKRLRTDRYSSSSNRVKPDENGNPEPIPI